MSLAQKLWFLLLPTIALSLAIYGWVGQRNRNEALVHEASAELQSYGALIEAGTATVRMTREDARIRDRIEGLVQAERLYGIAMLDEEGKIAIITNSIDDPASAEVITAFAERALRAGGDLEEPMTLGETPVLARHVRFVGGWPERAIVLRDLSYLTRLSSELTRGLVLTAIALVMVTGLVLGVVTRATVGRPAGLIVAGVGSVSAGNLDTKVPETGTRELAQLARAFNHMTSSLRDAKQEAERQEAARLAVERKLQHFQALAAVGQVAASVGHEIGSPLNVILGRALRAAAQPSCDPSARREFETIAHQCERISRYVTQLLAAARPTRDVHGTCDAAEVARDTLAFLGPDCRDRRIDARFEVVRGGAKDERSTMVALPADVLFQVMFNLCLNAAQAQGPGGKFVLRIISAGAAESGQKARTYIEVEDWGPGVPEELGSAVFEPFVTTKQAQGGTGLGLAIVSGIARDAGGSIELLPTSHDGARFRVSLPLSRSPR